MKQKYIKFVTGSVDSAANAKTASVVLKKMIVKKTDNLEELFDEVIWDSYSQKKFINRKYLDDFLIDFDPDQDEVYGATWQAGIKGEPILCPVAKLDENKQWRLLYGTDEHF